MSGKKSIKATSKSANAKKPVKRHTRKSRQMSKGKVITAVLSIAAFIYLVYQIYILVASLA